MKIPTLPTKYPQRFILLAALWLLLLGATGCQEAAQETGLTVGPDGLVLRDSSGTETKVSGEGQVFWLHQAKGGQKLDKLEGVRGEDFKRFRSYSESMRLEPKRYKFSDDGKEYLLSSEGFRAVSASRYGFIFLFEDGKWSLSFSLKSNCEKEALEINYSGITRDGANEGSYISWSSSTIVDEEGVQVVRRLIRSQARMAVGDTGTEIVIIDNLNPASNPPDCCDAANLVCEAGTATGEPAGGTYAVPGGWTEDWHLNNADVCVWEYCWWIIVADKATGEIRCYNTLECDFRLQIWDDHTISALLEAGCNAEEAVTICPG